MFIPAIDLSTHIQDIVNVLHYEDLRDVILVGHSYGATQSAKRRPAYRLPIAAGLQPLAIGNPDAALLPRAYVACLESRDVPLYSPFIDAAARAMREGWNYFELPTGHQAMETMPNELADILLRLV